MNIWEYHRQRGELVYRFKQSESPVLTQPGPWGRSLPNQPGDARWNGYCAALAVLWCSLRSAELDYQYDKGTKRLDGIADWRAAKEQSIYRGGTLANSYAEENDVLRLFQRNGFHGVQIKHMNIGATGEHVRNTIQAKEAGLYYLSLKGNAGGHGVATQLDKDGTWRFFDANYGHFVFQNGERFQWFLNQLMRRMYDGKLDSSFFIYHLTGYGKQSVKSLIQRFGG